MTSSTEVISRLTFREELAQQRWDDHRFYHQSRVTQSLHLFSALCFLFTYGLMPFNPIAASLFGWTVAMWSRQIGHFFFEPKGFDQVNKVTFQHKEEVKTGYNLQRKVMLLGAWLSVPAAPSDSFLAAWRLDLEPRRPEAVERYRSVTGYLPVTPMSIVAIFKGPYFASGREQSK